ncbi:MAG: protein kinase [Desulfobacteraceae bacterium]|nr:MAG: protein kinase [Desulfobacteraceae bacterium]
MQLRVGQKIQTESTGQEFTVKKKLGEGGQGIVYLVEGAQGSYAVKWYNREQSTEDQKISIRYLVHQGPPKGNAGKRFIWPMDLATVPDDDQFGYLMPLIDTGRFAELGEVWAHLKPAPGFPALCEISYQAANSYRALHLSGHCYRDISSGNLMFDPKSGDVVICDNDNVGINRQSQCQVLGTPEYMAPEIVMGTADPSTDKDLHSLAVLLFYLWVWHHPMHGEIEYNIRSWDLPAKKRVYGENPVFIFDPKDRSNQLPNDPEYATAKKRWVYCPAPLKELFTRAFTVGLKQPSHRVTEGEWQSLFLELKDNILACPKCKAENMWDASIQSLNCWHCKTSIFLPPKMIFSHTGGKHVLLLNKDAKILVRHVNPFPSEEESANLAGQVVQNPNKPNVWGIRNLTDASWTITQPDGKTSSLNPQSAIPINPELKFDIQGTKAEIVI